MPKSRGRKRKKAAATLSGIAGRHPVSDAILEAQLEAFREKFGRDPGPGDPVFFDPDKDVPTQMAAFPDDELMAEFIELGAQPQHVYAYKKTGLMGLDHTVSGWPAQELQEWRAAIKEYFQLEKRAGRDS
jgi:hypothetical protein